MYIKSTSDRPTDRAQALNNTESDVNAFIWVYHAVQTVLAVAVAAIVIVVVILVMVYIHCA